MRDIPITSANLLHGFDIETTHGFVSSHVVTGVNIFSDVLSSLSNVFGWRSESSNKQIDSIKQEALKKLKIEVKKVGANGIIGVTIDVDEISGGGKAMFMITASGTAVKVGKTKSTHSMNTLSSNSLNKLIVAEELVEKSKAGKLSYTEENIAKAIECECYELGPYFITKASEGAFNDDYLVNTKLPTILPYFMSLPPEIAIKAAHSQIGASSYQNKLILELIQRCELFDFNEINKLIDRKEAHYSSFIIRACNSAKPSYTESDIAQFKSLLNKLEVLKTLSLEKYSKKGMLGTKTLWKCICGTEVEEDRNSCHECDKTINGYTLESYIATEQNIIRAINVLSKTFKSD